MTYKVLYGILFFVVSAGTAQAQFEEDETTKEITVGLNLNTNGGIVGGVNGRYAIKRSDKQYHSFSLEIVNVKHQKEERFSSVITGNSFIPGKINYLLALRPQYAREFRIFEKYPEEGIRLTGVLGVGPTLGIVKPYYIEYDYTSNSDPLNTITKIEAYDPEVHVATNRVLGSANFFTGFWKSKIRPGINVKGALNFEFGKFESILSGIETGLTIEAFPKHVELFPTEGNKYVYSAVFITFYYGTRS